MLIIVTIINDVNGRGALRVRKRLVREAKGLE